MKKLTFAFIAVVFASLATVPMVNLLSESTSKTAQFEVREPKSLSISTLFNFDIVAGWLSKVLYQFGISIDPAQVIIGQNDWLYLGDRHEKTRSVTRRGNTQEIITLGRKIGISATAWDRWLRRNGVQIFRVMLAPNKDSIYPEYLPDWAKPMDSSATDALMLSTGSDLYIDLRSELIEAKSQHKEALYYRTDTHWNSLGAAHGFQSFARKTAKAEHSLRWPLSRGIHVVQISARKGGDLARFLRLDEHLSDIEPMIGGLGDGPIEAIHYDFDSGKRITQENVSRTITPTTTLRVSSAQALNKKKVLWLRDSFGVALAPFMAATFTETVQVHWNEALRNNGQRLVELVKKWQPDYVFVTVIERAALSEVFTSLPPE